MHLSLLTILVRAYDEAIDFYTRMLGFELVEDTDLGNGKRWVRVRPPSSPHADGPAFLLAHAATPEQESAVGNQTGDRVMAFLHTTDFHRDYNAMRSRGVQFVRPPTEQSYGTVAVFVDLYGNRFDLIGISAINRESEPRR